MPTRESLAEIARMSYLDVRLPPAPPRVLHVLLDYDSDEGVLRFIRDAVTTQSKRALKMAQEAGVPTP